MSSGGITKAGNAPALRVLIEEAWTYSTPTRVSPKQQARLEAVRRLCEISIGKHKPRPCKTDIDAARPAK